MAMSGKPLFITGGAGTGKSRLCKFLAQDPRYPGLQTHEIDVLTDRYGMKVWRSYLENKTSSAMRMYWVYGPSRNMITVIGLEPHPEDKKNGAGVSI